MSLNCAQNSFLFYLKLEIIELFLPEKKKEIKN